MSDSDLNDLERRLAGWRPAGEGLDADAMLFAAGRASVRRSPARFAWPAIAAGLVVALGVLSNRLAGERAVNQELVAQLQSAKSSVLVAAPTLNLPETSYLSARRALERDPDGWIPPTLSGEAAGMTESPLYAGQRDWDADR
jgi:hypothetical protein